MKGKKSVIFEAVDIVNNRCGNFTHNTYMYIFYFLRWYFGAISRTKAEEYLMFVANLSGSFLIRAVEKDDSNYVLSLKVWDNMEHQFVCKHYLMNHNKKGTHVSLKGARLLILY